MAVGARAPRIVVVRALRGLGDFLCAIPALRCLRRQSPHARIQFVGLEEIEPLASRFGGYIDEFIAFPGHPGIPEQGSPRGVTDIARAGGADVVVQMHGDGSHMNAFCMGLRPSMLVAFGPVLADGGAAVHTRPYPRSEHEIERCGRLAQEVVHLSTGRRPALDPRLEFPLTARDRVEARRLTEDLGLRSRPYAVLHPGSHLPDRRWPVEGFVRFGRALVDQGVNAVVTGVEEERALVAEVTRAIGRGAHPAAGRLSLGGLGGLIDGARGALTNDTGVSHVVAALGTPSVVVLMASDAHRWAPIDAGRHATVVREVAEPVAGAIRTPEGRWLLPPAIRDVMAAGVSVGLLSAPAGQGRSDAEREPLSIGASSR